MLIINRYLLILVGVTIILIGLAYCVDPNLLLERYGLTTSNVSEDNVYRGAYGGLFLTLGFAITYGFFSTSFRYTSTMIAALFMGGFAAGRVASIVSLGMPHEQIVGLLIFEIVTTLAFAWLLVTLPEKTHLQT